MEFVQVRDGKIVVDNLYYDNMASAVQLGLVPEGAIASSSRMNRPDQSNLA